MPLTTHPLSFNLRIIPGVSAMFAKGSLSERLAAARACGFTGVEGSAPAEPAELRRMLDDCGMQFVCMSLGHGSTPADAFGIAALPGRQAEFREKVRRGIEQAVALACPAIHPVGGLVPPNQRLMCEDLYVENLHVACELADAAALQVLIEPICAARQPQYVLQTHADAIRIIRSLDVPNLRLMVDMFHAHMAGESTAELALHHADLIGLLQVADAPVRRQPLPNDTRLRATLDALEARRWRGWISAEYVPDDGDTDAFGWIRLLDASPNQGEISA